MVIEKKLVKDVLERYFDATEVLLNEVKQQGIAMDSESEGAIELQNIIKELSAPNEEADRVRLAFMELSEKIESELHRLHAQQLYPDPCSGTDRKFQLMDEILNLHKDILLTLGDSVPQFSLIGTFRAWRDIGLLDFAIDQQNYLRSTKFIHLWDAVQYFEMQRYLFSRLFEYLDLTDNL